jgi:hypothetical protein
VEKITHRAADPRAAAVQDARVSQALTLSVTDNRDGGELVLAPGLLFGFFSRELHAAFIRQTDETESDAAD